MAVLTIMKYVSSDDLHSYRYEKVLANSLTERSPAYILFRLTLILAKACPFKLRAPNPLFQHVRRVRLQVRLPRPSFPQAQNTSIRKPRLHPRLPARLDPIPWGNSLGAVHGRLRNYLRSNSLPQNHRALISSTTCLQTTPSRPATQALYKIRQPLGGLFPRLQG
jgi:hypothetical protein